MEQFPEEAPLEHKDISGERRPKYSPEIAMRVRAEFFSGLLEEALKNYATARKENPGGKPPLQSAEFFFKKAWDNFTEPLLEYEDMFADLMRKNWESHGAKSRAFTALKERRAKVLKSIKVVIPDFGELDRAQQQKAVAKLYEGYAVFIQKEEANLGKFAEVMGRDSWLGLEAYLHTEKDAFLKGEMETLLGRKKRKSERRKLRQHQETPPQGVDG